MSYSLEKTVQSLRDIEEAFVYIAEDDLDSAPRFATGLKIASGNTIIILIDSGR